MGAIRSTLDPLDTLWQSRRGRSLPLPPRLARFYGNLRMPAPAQRPWIISNFVTTLDGIVSLSVKGASSGGPISGFNRQDRMVMGLLRAIADVIVVGAGTLGVGRHHVWTAEEIYPDLADDYAQLRRSQGKSRPPLNVIVTGSGRIDMRSRIFTSGKVPVMIVTTTPGAARLAKQRLPDLVQVRTVRGGKGGSINPASVIAQARRGSSARLILVEGGPRLLGDFYAAKQLDEQFLTLAPQIAGRDFGDGRLSLVMGRTFAPQHPLWGRLTDVRRGASHLFLRYAFAS